MPRNPEQTAELAEDFAAPELMFQELDGLLGYRLRRAQGAMHRDFMAECRDSSSTQKQTATLWLIQANPGVAQVSVAAALGWIGATMMSITDRLEERGLVIATLHGRSPSPGAVSHARGQTSLRKVKSRIAEHEARVKALSRRRTRGAIERLQKFQALA